MRPELHRRSKALAVAWLCAALATGCASLSAPDASRDDATHQQDTASARNAAEETLHAAIRAAKPRQSNLPRARRLLETLLAAEDADALALQPYARALLEQIQERQRLAGLHERLTQQLERSNDALKDSEQRNIALQDKLDALAEIERSLAPRVPSPIRPRALPQ